MNTLPEDMKVDAIPVPTSTVIASLSERGQLEWALASERAKCSVLAEWVLNLKERLEEAKAYTAEALADALRARVDGKRDNDGTQSTTFIP